MTITDFTDYMRYERGRSERTIESTAHVIAFLLP